MSVGSRKPLNRVCFNTALSAGILASAVTGGAGAQEAVVPLNELPNRLYSFETANSYGGGTLELNIGTSQTDPGSAAGTGNQTYFGGGSYTLNNGLTLGVDLQNYVDRVTGPIGGTKPEIEMGLVSGWAKYNFYDDGRLSFSGLASVETFLELNSTLFGGNNNNVVIGSIKAPLSYTAAPGLQLHLTPSVSVLPETLGGGAFYGTIASLGAGISYKPAERLSFFGSVDVPVSGNNSISSSGSYESTPVWVAGGRYNVTPKIALDAYVTNGIGITPATSVLAMWPGGDAVLGGVQLVYTPGAKRPESYRGAPLVVTPRQENLQQDGFTVGSADTLEPGFMRVSGWYGADNNAGVLFGMSPDRDSEIQLIFEDYSDNPTVPGNLIPRDDPRFMIGGKLRFMDQNNGNPFSLSGRALYGRSTNSNNQIGVFFAEAMASYKTDGALTLTANPKIAAFGNTEIAGMGLSANYEMFDGLELIAEATPVWMDGSETTWSAGMRYNFGQSGFAVDAMATNAIGRQGLGTMVAQDDVRASVMITKTFDLRGLRR